MTDPTATRRTSSEARNALTVVGISDLAVSANPQDILVTYSLGSCVGVSIYDSVAGVGGLIHCMLPLSRGSEEKAKEKPAMFVDTGLIVLLNAMYALGATRENLTIKVAGAASPMDPGGRFRIGERNHTVLRKVLWKNELMIHSEDVGGTAPRTVRLVMATGTTLLTSPGMETEL